MATSLFSLESVERKLGEGKINLERKAGRKINFVLQVGRKINLERKAGRKILFELPVPTFGK